MSFDNKKANSYAVLIVYQALFWAVYIYSFDPRDNKLRYVVPPFYN